jgi:carbamate kinase
VFKQDGQKWRRVVPSPLPKRIFEIRPIKWLLEHHTIVICAGGGGIPTMYEKGADRKLVGVEAVIDKDLCSELLARELDADLFVMLTDAEAVFLDWGQPTQRQIRQATPASLADIPFAAGSMGPKVTQPVALPRRRAKGGNRRAGGSRAHSRRRGRHHDLDRGQRDELRGLSAW